MYKSRRCRSLGLALWPITLSCLAILLSARSIGAAPDDPPVTLISTIAIWAAESNQANARMGDAVATAGDVNGDGASDVIVSAPLFDNGQTDEGRAYVYLGSTAGPATSPAWTAEANQAGAQFGAAAATAGDVNGDGYDDVIVGAPLYDNGQTDEGRVFLYAGSASGLAASPSWTYEANSASAQLGFSAAWAGDINDDGFGDVIVGAPGYTNGQAQEGAVFVFLGSDSGLSAVPAWSIESDVAGAALGNAVAAAGDTDADGYADIVVGAWRYTNDQAAEGRALLFLGGVTGPALTPAWTAEGDQDSCAFGVSVSTAGDANGDGYADVAIGASAFDAGELNEGRALLFLGSETALAAAPSAILDGNQIGASFGASLSTGGDANGDGYADLLVGAPGFDGVQVDQGRAFLFAGGGAGLETVALWFAGPNQLGAGTGGAVATAGDVNADGFGDLIVGVDLFDNGQTNEGRVFVYAGSGSDFPATATWTEESDEALASLGYSAALAGDVNGDGYSDVIVGAPDMPDPFLTRSGPGAGSTFVYFGSDSGLAIAPDWSAESEAASTSFGFAVSGAGDVNGDGYSDVIVGARDLDNGQGDEGAAFVYHGSADGLSASPDWFVEANQDSAQMGCSVSSAGDVNGDGYSDVIVGAWRYDGTITDEGAAFVYHGGPDGLSPTPDWVSTSGQTAPLPEYGFDVASAGDVNGDGYGDVIVGSPHFRNGQSFEGRAFVYLGSDSGLASEPVWTTESNQENGHLGEFVTSAGDVNGDGYSDVMIGGLYYTVDQFQEGRVWLHFGSATGPSAAPSWISDGNQAEGHLGYSGSGAGDVNGDGYSDVVLGHLHYSNGQSQEGRLRVYTGSSAGPGANPAWTVESGQAGAWLGAAVSGAGDVNGDGFGDIVAGAPYHDAGQTDEGSVSLYYGNGAKGLSRVPRQMHVDPPGPIALLGLTDADNEFRLHLDGRTLAGRGDVRLQWEIRPLGVAFDGIALDVGATFDTGVPQPGAGSRIALEGLVSGLVADEPYHWRARVVTASPLFPRSPWFSMPGNARRETDLRTHRAPDCAVTPDTLSFGTVTVGADSLSTFTIENTGGGILSGTVTEGCTDFEIMGDATYSLTAGQIDTITVRFAPTSEGPASCTIVTGSTCADVVAIGTGFLEPVCAVTPDTLSFGTVAVGAESVMTFVIENTGGGTLSGTVTEECTDFEIIGDASYSLTAGQSDTTTVRFAPTAEGPVSCTIMTGSSCLDVAATGTGLPAPSCAVTPDTLSFGTVTVGADSLSTFTIENTGAGTLSGTVTEACADFEIVGDASYSLAAGEIDTITVRFAPTSEGPASCAIVTGSTCADVAALGAGFMETVCAVTPDTLSFGTVAVGAESVMTFIIENTGGGTLSGTVTEACADFEIVGDASYSLVAGEIDTITVRFAPTAEGVASCTIETGSPCANVSADGIGFLAPTGVENPGAAPREASLSPSTPNPFRTMTSLSFAIPRAGHVTLSIYDVSGRLVRTLVDTALPAAWHDVVWDGTDGRGARVSPGVYLYELRAGSFRDSRRMVLAK